MEDQSTLNKIRDNALNKAAHANEQANRRRLRFCDKCFTAGAGLLLVEGQGYCFGCMEKMLQTMRGYDMIPPAVLNYLRGLDKGAGNG